MLSDDEDLVSPLGGDLEAHRAETNTPPEVEIDPYAALEAQFKEAAAERDAARAEAAAEKARVSELRSRVADHETSEVHTHKALFEHALVSTQSALDAAKERYREARHAGDIDEELAATEALTDARNELRQLRAGYEQVNEAIKNPPKRSQGEPAGDPIEAYIDANFAEPRDREWIRAHKDDIFGSEQRKQLAVIGDQAAGLRGFKAGTDEYYAFLDAHMGYETDDAEVEDDAPVTLVPKPVARPAAHGKSKNAPGAPPGRNARGNAGSGVEAASPEVVALARDLGMSVARYTELQKGLEENKYPGYRLLR
jgi:hypothetical protein